MALYKRRYASKTPNCLETVRETEPDGVGRRETQETWMEDILGHRI